MGKMENVPKYYVFFPLDREFDWLIVISLLGYQSTEYKRAKA